MIYSRLVVTVKTGTSRAYNHCNGSALLSLMLMAGNMTNFAAL